MVTGCRLAVSYVPLMPTNHSKVSATPTQLSPSNTATGKWIWIAGSEHGLYMTIHKNMLDMLTTPEHGQKQCCQLVRNTVASKLV
jgi:hypothetical protein